MSLLSRLKGKGPSGFGYGSSAEDVTEGLDLSGKTFAITGCNSGLGLETMRVLGLRGAHIFALARSEEKAEKAISRSDAAGTPLACELSEPTSIKACVARIQDTGRRVSVGFLGASHAYSLLLVSKCEVFMNA